MTSTNWRNILEQEAGKAYYQQMQSIISEQRRADEVIYPVEQDVFNALSFTDVEQVSVVILGQDPYHGEGQAHGLAFSVPYGVKVPPSLVNIYKELQQDIDGFEIPDHGCLVDWAKQGVLLLNTVLTVKQGQAHSHAKLGWETFTDRLIEVINEQNQGCVFILWGSHAQKKGRDINNNKHLVVSGPHPSPLSAYRGFFGCQHFSKANKWLKNKGQPEIDWRLSPMQMNL
ncbi:uracil-DNA glycosylase [Thalassotalea fusca]